MGVAMNTIGVDTSLSRFSPASASVPESRSTIAQLYGVDTHARLGIEAPGRLPLGGRDRYVDIAHHRTGGGRELYTQLLRRLTERGYRRAFAGITQPNEASNGFHRSFGFRHAGLYRRVGWKHDSWHDVAWMQLDLLGAAEQDGPNPNHLIRRYVGDMCTTTGETGSALTHVTIVLTRGDSRCVAISYR